MQNIIDFDLFFNTHKSKYNESVVLSPKDKAAGVKILSKEPYAQELYNIYSGTGIFNLKNPAKDLELDQIYSVTLKSFDRKDRLICAEELVSKQAVFIPLRELIGNITIEDLQDTMVNSTQIKVMVYRKDNGEIFASERKCASLIFKQDLDGYLKNNEFFTIKVLELIDGGYIALYKNSIRCFLPGSQAAANIITDFSTLLGKEINVMVENYDSYNNLYIVSYKKYIKNTLSTRVHELKFGEKLTGVLTNKPYNFGVFVEWDNYFTGLIHQTDFIDYPSVMNTMKSGDKIDFYVKDITSKKGDTRIILTTDLNSVSESKLVWQKLKNDAEGKILDFEVDNNRGQLEVTLPNNTVTYITVDLNKLKHLTKKSNQIKVYKIDTLKQSIKFDFIF